MPKNDSTSQRGLLPEEEEFATLLAQQGVAAALAYLNRRTPHRYTGLFRFDGDVLRTQTFFDCHHSARQPEQELQLAMTYCALMGREPTSSGSTEALPEPPASKVVPSPLFYHSVLIRDAQGGAYGTLCHYDWQRCQQRITDLSLLETAATLLHAHYSLSHTE